MLAAFVNNPDPAEIAPRLESALASASLEPLDAEQTGNFAVFCALLMKWNERTNLTAIRDLDGILSRHFVECIGCARALPDDIVTLLDFGSGAGFPGIPIALCRPEIGVTLAESQGKKAAFLREAVRTLNLPTRVHGGRAEALDCAFDCVILRAVDDLEKAVEAAVSLVSPAGRLALMTTEPGLECLNASLAGAIDWAEPVRLPGGNTRILALGRTNRVS